MKRILLISAVFLLVLIFPLSAEDTYLQLFDKVLAIEDSLAKGISDQLLKDIEAVRKQIENSPYTDLQQHLQIIDHLIMKNSQPTEFQESLQKEIEEINGRGKMKAYNLAAVISGSTTVLAGAALATSLILAESMHEQYLAADTVSEANDFRYKRDMFDIAAISSAGLLVAGAVTTTSLLALRPTASEISGKNYIDFGPELSGISVSQPLFANLVSKRTQILGDLEKLQEKKKKRKIFIDITKYSTITTAAAMAGCLILSSTAYYYYNHSDSVDTVRKMRDMTEICLYTGLGLGAMTIATLSVNIYLNSSVSDRKLKDRLKEVNNEIINYPFSKTSEE